MESKSTEMLSNSSELIKSKSSESNKSVSSSLADPNAMYKNCCSSLSDRRAAPSAILTGMEVQALRICDVNPNFSSDGNFEVSTYIFLTIAKLCFQTSRFWCGFIGAFLIEFTIFNHTKDRNTKVLVYIPNLFPIPYSQFSKH